MKVVREVDLTRKSQAHNKGLSFATIAGYGPNSALPHYQPSNATSKKIEKDSTFVLDSGGQYDGKIYLNQKFDVIKKSRYNILNLFRWNH